ncbi:MAG: hypothetical protein ABIR18_07175 [Chitinophagaceae bacterium]
MKRVFYSIAVLLAAAWVLSFFILHAGSSVHILIFSAAFCWVHAVITTPRKKYMLGNGRIGEMEESSEEQRA